ncbi:MAG TPA: NUDIX hydrolase [Acidiferrobacterales bacterium]|jgi:ADP-ribose pyrophosphatase YjhB (NUDIX family)
MIWTPHVTVAAVVERDGRFLLVEEEADGEIVINQPAGHLEERERLRDAVVRETLEETGWHFAPEFLLGVYRWSSPRNGITYLRFAFGGRLTGRESGRALDTGILRVLWLTPAELDARAAEHRSPQVRRCVDDYLAGARYPLASLCELE